MAEERNPTPTAEERKAAEAADKAQAAKDRENRAREKSWREFREDEEKASAEHKALADAQNREARERPVMEAPKAGVAGAETPVERQHEDTFDPNLAFNLPHDKAGPDMKENARVAAQGPFEARPL